MFVAAGNIARLCSRQIQPDQALHFTCSCLHQPDLPEKQVSVCYARQVTLLGEALEIVRIEVLPGPPSPSMCHISGANALSGSAGITSTFDIFLKVHKTDARAGV